MNKISKQINEIVNQKRQLVTNLNDKGIIANEEETLNSLVAKVMLITNSGDAKLGSKVISENGTYYSHNDGLDGYSSVDVNVLGGMTFAGTFSKNANNRTKNIKMFGDVPDYAFYQDKLNEVDLTKSESVGKYAFAYSGLTSIIAPNPLIISTNAFHTCGNMIGEITISKEQTDIEPYSFYACTKLKVKMHDKITKIDDYAFYNNSEEDWKSLPNSLEIIGNYAFFGNLKLNISEIPASVTSIGDFAFRGITIENLKIYDACTKIGAQCFRYSNNLTNIELGKGITILNSYCFADTNLKKITIHNPKPPTLYSTSVYNCNLEVIEVPASALETYKSASNWSEYADIMVGIEGE